MSQIADRISNRVQKLKFALPPGVCLQAHLSGLQAQKSRLQTKILPRPGSEGALEFYGFTRISREVFGVSKKEKQCYNQ